MRRAAIILFLIAFPVFAAEQRVAILAYHQVEPVPQLGWSVSVEDFKDQMLYLKTAGFNVVSIADAWDYLSGKRDSLPPNPVVITVDDGFVDAYTTVAPALKQFGYPWSLYIYPHFISRGSTALKWTQVKQLAAAGVDIESHTVHHPHLIRKSQMTKSDDEYAAWLTSELVDSKAEIEKQTGKPVRFLAYPYGDYDEGVEAATAKTYLIGLTSWAGFNTRSTKPTRLYRFPIMSDTTLEQFAKGVGAEMIELRDVTPASSSVSIGSRVAAEIAKPGDLDPASVHIILLGENATGQFDAASGSVTLNISKFTRGKEQVLIYGKRKSDGRPVTATWTFYTSAEAKARHDAIAQRLRELPLHHTQSKRD
jgi:peptidoglycan/xylan/chitin deacetylase (PgdA/CDA1 family)